MVQHSIGNFSNCQKNYSVYEIVEIINNNYLPKTGEIIAHESSNIHKKRSEFEKIYSDRQFFECYIDALLFKSFLIIIINAIK